MYVTYARYLSPDPLREKYYGINPYTYCAGDPVNFVDPDGREWETNEDETIANDLISALSNQLSYLNKKIQRIENKINQENTSSEKKARLERKMEDIKDQAIVINSTISGINDLGVSSVQYSFNTVSGGIAKMSSRSDGTIVINNYGTFGNRIHEITHAIQFDKGLLKVAIPGSDQFSANNFSVLEIQAYRAEYAGTGGRVPYSTNGAVKYMSDIGLEWLYGLKDDSGVYLYRPDNYR